MNKISNDKIALRKQAESQLHHISQTKVPEQSAEELLHELRVYQTELEMQNETLRQSQINLEESRDRYMDLYDFSPVGYLTLTREALISEVNLTCASLLEEARSKLICRHFAAFVDPEDSDRWHQVFMRALHHGEQQSCAVRLRRSDGTRFHAQLNLLCQIRNIDEPIVRITITDITKQNETRASELRMRHILDSTLDMIFIFSPDSLRFVYVNKGAVENIGYSSEELLQMSPPDLLRLIPEAECRAFVAPLISGRKNKLRFETIVNRKDGREFPVEVQLQLVQEDNHNSLFVAVVRDITKRKFAEGELRRQKNLMWQVIDMDPNMIFVRDETGKFLLANQTIADIYGVPIRNLIGRKISEINPDSSNLSGFLHTDDEVIKSMDKLSSTERATMPDGKQHWYFTTKRSLLQADGSINVLGIAVDISDLKQSEVKQAESYKELQRLALHLENIRAEERAKIARNLHDEMGATLAALKMRIAWLASKLPDGMPQLTDEVAHISDLVTEGIHTVRQVVAELRPNLLDDVGLVAAVKDFVKRFQHDTEIECTLILPDGDFALNESQSITVFRIIQESLSNVARHSQASKVNILFSLQGESLRLEIKDNGIGFAPTEKAQSYGLLGIKERALMIGGTTEIISTPGKGTLVSLTLPAAPSSA